MTGEDDLDLLYHLHDDDLVDDFKGCITEGNDVVLEAEKIFAMPGSIGMDCFARHLDTIPLLIGRLVDIEVRARALWKAIVGRNLVARTFNADNQVAYLGAVVFHMEESFRVAFAMAKQFKAENGFVFPKVNDYRPERTTAKLYNFPVASVQAETPNVSESLFSEAASDEAAADSRLPETDAPMLVESVDDTQWIDWMEGRFAIQPVKALVVASPPVAGPGAAQQIAQSSPILGDKLVDELMGLIKKSVVPLASSLSSNPVEAAVAEPPVQLEIRWLDTSGHTNDRPRLPAEPPVVVKAPAVPRKPPLFTTGPVDPNRRVVHRH